jgi:cytochrome P450
MDHRSDQRGDAAVSPAWTVERTAVADEDVCGTLVPAGSIVAVLPYLIHRNTAVWPNPASFDPGRFLPDAPERRRYAWIPRRPSASVQEPPLDSPSVVTP